MRAVNSGNTYTIYDNSISLLNELPPQTYLVNFDKQTGFFLTRYTDIKITEKMYGVHEEKVQKVLDAFEKFTRNLGVILSGDKGIGKSSFAKLLSMKAIAAGYPVIVVNTYVSGIAEYLASFDQTMMVLFDEFDKTFSKRGEYDCQAEMLTLFDGLAQGKKMFVLTCNDLRGLNDYLVNRPGRFHYHFRFEYPTPKDIRKYMKDNITIEISEKEIDKIVMFSRKTNLNYDCLRAIAFELNCGLTFKEAIKDLNIIKDTYDNSGIYICKLYFTNGQAVETKSRLDLFSESDTIYFPDKKFSADDIFECTIAPKNMDFDTEKSIFIVSANDMQYNIDTADYYDAEDRIAEIRTWVPECLEITRIQSAGIHYTI